MVSTLNRLFTKELAHGKDMYNLSTKETVRVIILKNEDHNSTNERLTVMYPKDSCINQGNELIYEGTHYLVLNRDARESDVYYKSDLLALTVAAIIYDNKSKNVYFFNVYANDVVSVSTNDQTYVTTLNASVTLLMPDNEATQKIVIDNYIQLWGYKYTIIHAVRKNGICSVYAEFYSISGTTINSASCPNNLDSNETYVTGNTAEVIATPKVYTDMTYTVNCNDCVVTYASSDESIAKFNGNVLEFVGVGEVTITTSYTCDFADVTGSSSTTINVTDPNAYTITYTTKDGEDQLYMEYDYNTVTAHLLKGGVEVELPEGATTEWTHVFSGTTTIEANNITYTPDGLVMNIAIGGSTKLLTETITFTCTVYNADGSVLAVGNAVAYDLIG